MAKKPKAMTSPVTHSFWASLSTYIGPYRRHVILSSLAAMYVGGMVAIQQLVVRYIIDDGLLLRTAEGVLAEPEARLKSALWWVGLYVFSSASRIGVGVWGMHQLIYLIENLLCDLRARFFHHVQGLCFRFHDEVSSGELFNYIMGSPLQSLKMFLHQASLQVPIQIVSWVVVVTALFTFDVLMTVIVLVIVLAVVWVNRSSRFRIRERSHDFMEVENSASRYVADMLRGARTVKMHAIEENVSVDFAQQVYRIRDMGQMLARGQVHESIKAEGLQYVGMALVFVIGVLMIIYRGMEVGVFVTFVSSVNMLMGNLLSLMNLNLVRANAEAGLERIDAVLSTETSTPDPGEAIPMDVDRLKKVEPNSEILSFHDVCFSYDENRPVLQGVNVKLLAGESVALVGGSGSGKTTFAKLAQRLYDPQSGSVSLLGEDLRRYPQNDLRACFGVVPQDPYLFQASLRDNIRILRPQADDSEVLRAVEEANLAEFIASLPEGLDSWVGEGGSTLSGGQKQRVAIARVMLADPAIHVFDEATSALDNESERLVQQALERSLRGRTSLIIAHRLSTIKGVDRVLVFSQGRIVQDGGYDELASQPGPFRDLLEI